MRKFVTVCFVVGMAGSACAQDCAQEIALAEAYYGRLQMEMAQSVNRQVSLEQQLKKLRAEIETLKKEHAQPQEKEEKK